MDSTVIEMTIMLGRRRRSGPDINEACTRVLAWLVSRLVMSSSTGSCQARRTARTRRRASPATAASRAWPTCSSTGRRGHRVHRISSMEPVLSAWADTCARCRLQEKLSCKLHCKYRLDGGFEREPPPRSESSGSHLHSPVPGQPQVMVMTAQAPQVDTVAVAQRYCLPRANVLPVEPDAIPRAKDR